MISSFYYQEAKKQERDIPPEAMARIVKSGEGVLWVDLENPTEAEIDILDESFGFHPLAIEDCRENTPYPKLDNFETHFFMVVLAPDIINIEDDDPAMLTLAVFLGKNYVVTYHRRALKSISEYRKTVGANLKKRLEVGPPYLAHEILDAVVDQHYASVSKLDDATEYYQDLILERPRKQYLDKVLSLRSHVLQLRRILSDERNMMNKLANNIEQLFEDDAKHYYSDLAEHLDQLSDRLDVSRDSLAGARDLYLSVSSNRTNEVVRTLTIVATMMMPLMFITSLYGMNVKLPGGQMDGYTAFYILLGMMVVVVAAFFMFFKNRKLL